MKHLTCLAFLLLFPRTTGSPLREAEYTCFHGNTDNPALSATSDCDSTVDRRIPTEADTGMSSRDESHGICAPSQFFEKQTVLEIRNVTSTAVHLSWSDVTRNLPDQTLKLAGYFVAGYSARHCFEATLPRSMSSYQKGSLLPWTNYTVHFRPFYTEDGETHDVYKIGRVASVAFRTLSSEPDVPVLLTVESRQPGRVVLNIFGPWRWNTDPIGFHVRWQPFKGSHGPRGELDVTLTPETYAEENMVNVTLPLRGGMTHRVSVSVVGAGDASRTLKSAELMLEVSVPFDFYDVSAEAVGSFAAFVSWSHLEMMDVFAVTVYEDNGAENHRVQSTQLIEAKEQAPSRHNILITNLQAWAHYVVNLAACSEGSCSDAGNATFSTPPSTIPAPLIIRVEATASSSFKVMWQYPHRDLRFFDGFRVEYCPESESSCFVAHTEETNHTVGNLKPDTTVEIRVAAQYKDIDARLSLGFEATASVTTWAKCIKLGNGTELSLNHLLTPHAVPAIYVQYEADVPESIGTWLASWRCVNSSVDYFQYKTQDHKEWKFCNDSARCDVTFNYGRNETFTSGYLTLAQSRHFETDTIEVLSESTNNPTKQFLVRGCNIHGCGSETSVAINKARQDPGPSSLSEVTVTLRETSALLRWNNPVRSGYDGIEVSWNCDGNRTVNRVTRYHIDSTAEDSREALIKGLPEHAEHCDFYVSTYSLRHQRRTYSLPVRATKE